MDKETMELCCEFAKFTHDNNFRKVGNWTKWKTITCSVDDYKEFTDEEMFNYFLENRYGNKD